MCVGKTVVPKGINEVKLIGSGKILENNKTVAQCKTPFGETAGGVTVMHVVVQPSPAKTKSGQTVLSFVFFIEIFVCSELPAYYVRLLVLFILSLLLIFIFVFCLICLIH